MLHEWGEERGQHTLTLQVSADLPGVDPRALKAVNECLYRLQYKVRVLEARNLFLQVVVWLLAAATVVSMALARL